MEEDVRESVENVAWSLVREFLSTKGFYSILLHMDVEVPRGPCSINSRRLLAAMLGLQRPTKGGGSILESLLHKTMARRRSALHNSPKVSTILDQHIQNDSTSRRENNLRTEDVKKKEEENSLESSSFITPNKAEINENISSPPPLHDIKNDTKAHAEAISCLVENILEEAIKEIETDLVVTDVDAIVHQENRKVAVSSNQLESSKSDCDICPKTENGKKPEAPQIFTSQKRYFSAFLTKLPPPKLNTKISTATPSVDVAPALPAEPKVEEAVATIEKEVATEKRAPQANAAVSRPLTLPSAMELKSVLLGTPEGQFLREWQQGELFIPVDGFASFESGVSGVLAVFQGFLLKAKIFCNELDKESAFISAVADMLWQSGQLTRACLAICGDEERLAGCGRYRRDGVTEAMLLLQLESLLETRAAVERHVRQLRAPGGLLLLVASLVLSKGLEEFRGRPPLLAKANAAALRNLALTGRLDARDARLRAEIGLLSLGEHYGHIRVPSGLKTPRWPIWVVEMGPDKYAVISSTNQKLVADWRAELAFRLQIFDSDGIRNAAISKNQDLLNEARCKEYGLQPQVEN